MYNKVLGVGLVALASLGTARPAVACSTPAPDFQVSPMTGGEAPDPPQNVRYSVERGKGPRSEGCSTMTTSCDDVGTITFTFPTPGDADSNTEDIGYEVTLVAGKLPDGAELSAQPRQGHQDGGQDSPTRVWVLWSDGATDDQQPLDLTITLTSIDRNGNRSAPSEPVHISDDAGDGCSVTASRRNRSFDVSWLLLLGAGIFHSRLLLGRLARTSRRASR